MPKMLKKRLSHKKRARQKNIKKIIGNEKKIKFVMRERVIHTIRK